MPKGITAEQMPIGLSKRKLRRVFGLVLQYFPSNPPPAIFIVVAKDLEGAYLSSILHVSADAGAGIIITYTHNPECFRCILPFPSQIVLSSASENDLSVFKRECVPAIAGKTILAQGR